MNYNISDIEHYITCPALCYLNREIEEKPVKQMIISNLRKGLNDIILRSLGSNRFDENAITRAVELILEIQKDEKEHDKNKEFLTLIYTNLDKLIREYEYTITGAVIPFQITSNGLTIDSAIDLTVKDEKRGYIYPAIVDFSKTRYEPFYNPIIYRVQSVIDYMNISNTNTEVVIFTPATQKRWIYDKNRFGPSASAAIDDITRSIQQEFFYTRVGWWCAGCAYRGICFKLLKRPK